MKTPQEYEQAWETFWHDAPDEAGGVFWDSDPSLSAGRHQSHFTPWFDPGLPLVDLGCGNGTLTRWLAGRYPRVLGVDLARAAVERAARDDPRGVAEYRQLDAGDLAAAAGLHADLGDMNVYMRGVLHQCEPADRAPLVAGIAELLGERGRVFAAELAEAAKGVLMGLATAPQGPPAKLGAVLGHGLVPGDVADAAVPGYFADAGLKVFARGEQALVTTEFDAGGNAIELPANWLVAGRSEV
ncbi:methyltransferase domain-containing protein [Streptomyces sp. CA-111067]|uniref:methyltransferase domain-containing protein n=1 Tax=Streptomyces sp. CA-111067 TaxID=3240046 RepID=UPI003D97A5BE